MKYSSIPAFDRDFKKLLRKFQSLGDDIEVAKKNAIELYHILQLDNGSIEVVPGYCSETILICKIRKFACKSLKGKGVRSGIRIIYAYYPETKNIEFIEMYYKGDQEDMNYGRAQGYLNER